MRNARRYDGRITIGMVPDADDLVQLAELNFKTLVDLRDESEKFGGLVARGARRHGLRYAAIPISREEIKLRDVERFYEVVFERGSAPIYAFSRFGKKPLAFLLLFEAVAAAEHVGHVFRRARRFGLGLDGDLCLQSFLVKFINDDGIAELVSTIRKTRSDLPLPTPKVRPGPTASEIDERVTGTLEAAARAWRSNRDAVLLRRSLVMLIDLLQDISS